VIADEVEKLQTARGEAMRCFYEVKNRHGEDHQPGYMAQFVRLTERLHALLRLADPTVGQQQAAVPKLSPVTLVVKTREEAEKYAPGGVPNAEAIRARLGLPG
jgi:hypothetical protein